MAVATTIYPDTATFGGVTYNSSNNGPLRFEWEVSSDPIEDWTGSSFFPTFGAAVNGRGRGRMRVRAAKQGTALGTKSNLVLTLVGKTTTVVVTMSNMILFSRSGEQDRAAAGSCTLGFFHESSDGLTDPEA